MHALIARGGWVCQDYFHSNWREEVFTFYGFMRGYATDREWQRSVAEARRTLARTDALLQAIQAHDTPLSERATALTGPLGRTP